MKKIQSKKRVFIITTRLGDIDDLRTLYILSKVITLQDKFEVKLIEMSDAKYPGKNIQSIKSSLSCDFIAINPWRTEENSQTTKNYISYVQSVASGKSKVPTSSDRAFSIKTKNGGLIKGYLENGKVIRLREFCGNNQVILTGLDDNQNILFHEEIIDGKTASRKYISTSGKVCSSYSIDKGEIINCKYWPDTDMLITSSNSDDHKTRFLEQILNDGDVVITETPHYDALLSKLDDDIKIIHVVREDVFKPERRNVISPKYRTLFAKDYIIGNDDCIVVSEEKIKNKLVKRMPRLAEKIVHVTDIDIFNISGAQNDESLHQQYQDKWVELIDEREYKTHRQGLWDVTKEYSIIAEHRYMGARLWHLSLVDLQKNYHGAILGWSWLILRPLTMLALYWFIVAIGLHSNTIANEKYSYLPWLAVGLCSWFFMSDMINAGVGSFRKYRYLVTKMRFPTSTIPSIILISNLIVHIIILLCVMVYLITQGYLSIHWLQIPLLIGLTSVFMWYWSLLSAPLGAISRDFTQLVKTLMRILVWVSGVLWDIKSIDISWVRFVMQLNPVYYIAESYRQALIYHHWIVASWKHLLVFVAELVIICILSVTVYKRTKSELADTI